MKQDSTRITLCRGSEIIDQNAQIEWYSGCELYYRPKRIKINNVWEEVFTYEKSIRENDVSGVREIVFRCHIGDNRIIDAVINFNPRGIDTPS